MHENNPFDRHAEPVDRTVRRLRIGAWAAPAAAVLWVAIWIGVSVWRGGAPPWQTYLILGLTLLLAGGLAALSLALAAALESSARLERRLREWSETRPPPHVASTTPTHSGGDASRQRSDPGTDATSTRREGGGHRPDAPAPAYEEILALLRDIRDNTLLSEAERRDKAARVEQHEFAEADALLHRLAHEGEFDAAFEHLAELSRRYPDRAALPALAAFLERARTDRERQDMTAYTKRIDELMSISAWDRAREVVAELRHRYPDAAAVGPLEARIEREYSLYEDSQRQRMYAEIQRFVARRRWAEALAAAQTFIDRFPHRAESDSLRLQVETLANNAHVTARQEMEAEITELAKRGQYAEAEALARQAIDRWPDSPQAEILRSQLDRLHELATNPNAPPPRVRPSGAN